MPPTHSLKSGLRQSWDEILNFCNTGLAQFQPVKPEVDGSCAGNPWQAGVAGRQLGQIQLCLLDASSIAARTYSVADRLVICCHHKICQTRLVLFRRERFPAILDVFFHEAKSNNRSDELGWVFTIIVVRPPRIRPGKSDRRDHRNPLKWIKNIPAAHSPSSCNSHDTNNPNSGAPEFSLQYTYDETGEPYQNNSNIKQVFGVHDNESEVLTAAAKTRDDCNCDGPPSFAPAVILVTPLKFIW